MQTVNDTSSPSRSRSRLHPANLPTWLRWLLAGVVGVVLLLGAALVALRVSRPGVLPGVRIADVELGGMDRTELEATVRGYATDRAGEALTVALDDGRVTATAADAGYALDAEETIDRVWRRGRQANPLVALGDQVRAFSQEIPVAPVRSLDDGTLTAFVEATAADLDRPAVEGAVAFDGTDVARTDPEPGAEVQREELTDLVRDAVRSPGPDLLDAPATTLAPVTTAAEVDAAVARAETAVGAPVVLERGDGALTFTPEELATVLSIEREISDGAATFSLRADREAVEEVVTDDELDAVESAPVSASFSVSGGEVDIAPSQEGFAFDAAAVTEQLPSVAAEEPQEDVRSATLAGEVLTPDRTTEEAEELGIVEPVASFTSDFACCQTRVTNIQRFADIVDGTVAEPGEVLSLNGIVGERTRAKGFVGGGAILRGEYVEQVGGGVSQFATTFFNAAYFGGYEIVEYKAHSYYIDRYPVGRESTINWPNVDVKVRNDSPYGMLVDTSYTDTSVTVTLYGTEWVDVDSVTGEPHRFRSPETEVEINEELPEGSERVTQEGSTGFDINVTRTLTFPDGETTERTFFTRYLPEPRIIERNPA